MVSKNIGNVGKDVKVPKLSNTQIIVIALVLIFVIYGVLVLPSFIGISFMVFYNKIVEYIGNNSVKKVDIKNEIVENKEFE